MKICYSGCMFSGKTTEICNNFEVVIRPKKDTRQKILVSHGGVEFKGKQFIVDNIEDAVECLNYNIIGIDEAQFFDNFDILDEWDSDDKTFIIVGLDLDSNDRIFNKKFYELCQTNKHIKKTAICAKCKSVARYSRPKFIKTQRDVISDEYYPYCGFC